MNRFEVSRTDLRKGRWVQADDRPLADGEVRLRVAEFALTANNVTYAAFGEAMRYWAFFPTDDASTGCVPVWGFATVEASRCDGVAEGERVYGYLPMADTVTLQPARVDAASFMDGAAHRRELHPVYNHYRFCRADPGYDAAHEAEQSLLQPLFSTSFLIDDFLADNDFFGARQVLLSSASSKTAYGTAFCLAQRGGIGVIGLTSPGNAAFTRSLGCYGRVLAYDEVATLDAAVPTVYVDMSGSAPLRGAVHHHFGAQLVHSCAVGGTHWDELAAGGGERLPGARPTLFFAPAQIKKRQADWGAAGLAQRLAQAWRAFLTPVCDPQRPWLHVARARGPEAIASTWSTLVTGRVDPRDGHVLGL